MKRDSKDTLGGKGRTKKGLVTGTKRRETVKRKRNRAKRGWSKIRKEFVRWCTRQVLTTDKKIQSGETIEGCSTEFVVSRVGRLIVVLDRGWFMEQNVCPMGERVKRRFG
jgi:hypothetical protein